MAAKSAIDEISEAVAVLQSGQKREARQRLLELWERLKGCALPAERCILAHFLADTEEEARRELDWDLIALQSATGGPSESNADALTPELAGFLPSLHLNVGDAYRRLGDLPAARRHADRALAFESSPYYLFHPLALERIAADLPGVQLIVLVRDPVERAYSAHAHEFARGFETEPFARAPDLEATRLAGEVERMVGDAAYESRAHRHQAYRSRGEYAAQLARAETLLGRGRIHVVDSHRFFAEPEVVLDEVLTFLGVRTRVATPFDRHNARPRLPLDPGLARELRAHFAPHDAALEPWLGGPPTWVAQGW